MKFDYYALNSGIATTWKGMRAPEIPTAPKGSVLRAREGRRLGGRAVRVSIKYPTLRRLENAEKKPCAPGKATHIALGNDKDRCAALIIERMAGGYVLQDRNGRTRFVEHDTLEFLAMDFYEWEWRELPTAVGSVVTDHFDVPYVLEESGEWVSRRFLHGETRISARRLESWECMILHDAGAEKEEKQ